MTRPSCASLRSKVEWLIAVVGSLDVRCAARCTLFQYDRSDHSSRKPGDVAEFDSATENVRKLTKVHGSVGEKSRPGKLFIANFTLGAMSVFSSIRCLFIINMMWITTAWLEVSGKSWGILALDSGEWSSVWWHYFSFDICLSRWGEEAELDGEHDNYFKTYCTGLDVSWSYDRPADFLWHQFCPNVNCSKCASSVAL